MPLNYGVSALCAGARWKRASRTISRRPSSRGIPGSERSSGSCSSEELRKPRWRVAGRRCLEYSEAQRRRAEPPRGSRRTRFSSATPFRGENTAAPSDGGAASEGHSLTDDKFKIFSGSANPTLAEEICRFLGAKPGRSNLGQFSDGEIYFQILE